MSDERRAVLHRARVVMGFDVATMLLAVEGCAASAFCRRTNRTGAPLDDLAWIFGTEARVERLAAEGMRAREEMEAAQRKAAQPAASPPVPCPEEVRSRLADMRAFFNRRSGVR